MTNLRLNALLTLFALLLAPWSYALGQQVAVDNDSAATTDALLQRLDSIQLADITVTAQRQLIKQEIDRIGYDVQADIASRTSTVLEMLRKVPLVNVDGQDNIRVNGETDFVIYRNGHPDPSLGSNAQEMLKAMPASNVKRIEVITNPGAKYDAEGAQLILNIVMRDHFSFRCLAGAASIGLTAPFPLTVNPTVSLTTQVNKVVMSLGGGSYVDHSRKQSAPTTTWAQYRQSGNQLFIDQSKRVRSNMHYGHLRISWEPDTLRLVAASFNLSNVNRHNHEVGDWLMQDASGVELYGYDSDMKQRMSYLNVTGRADYERRTHQHGEAITLSYMINLQHSTFDKLTAYDGNMLVNYIGVTSNDNQHFAENTVQLDWTRPFAQHHKMDIGIKCIHRLNRSHSVSDYLGSDLLDDVRFNHTTHIAAAYASYQFNRNRWKGRAGIRYEHSVLHGEFPDGTQEAFSRHLNDWAPDASVSYQANEADNLTLSYGSSIRRPSIMLLNPAVSMSPNTRSYGNTGLGSVHLHDITLTWMHIGSRITWRIEPAITIVNDGITNIKWAEGDVTVSTYANELQRTSARLSGYVQWQLHANTSLQINASLRHERWHSDNLNITNNRWVTALYANCDQQLPYNISMSLYGGFNGGNVTGLYGHDGDLGYYGLSLQRSFLKDDRLTVSIHADDWFSGRYTYQHRYVTQGDVISRSTMRWTGVTAGVRVSFRFGKLNTHVKNANHTISNNDLQGLDN